MSGHGAHVTSRRELRTSVKKTETEEIRNPDSDVSIEESAFSDLKL